MNFNEKYPSAKYRDEPEPLIWHSGCLAHCSNCGKMTPWRDLSWGCAVSSCSNECVEASWAGYFSSDEAIAAGVQSRPLDVVFPSDRRRAEEAAKAKAAEVVAAPVPVPSSEADQSPKAPSELPNGEVASVNLIS